MYGILIVRNLLWPKLVCHCTAHYIIEWIYMRSKVRVPDILELALEMKTKERMRNGHFFEHPVLACTITGGLP